DGVESEAIEEALSLIESAAAPIIRRRVPTCGPLLPEDPYNLAAFVATMMGRTPTTFKLASRVAVKAATDKMKADVESWRENPPSWRAFVEEFNAAHPEDRRIGLDFDFEKFDPKHWKISIKREADMAPTAIGAAFYMVVPLLRMGWTIYRSFAPDYFV